MLIGTSWYSKTSSNTPRISTETSMKKTDPFWAVYRIKDPGPLQRLNNQETTLSQPCVCQSWLKKLCLGTIRIWGQEKSRKNQATPTKPAVTIPECGYGLCNPAKTQQSSVHQKKQPSAFLGGQIDPCPPRCSRVTGRLRWKSLDTSLLRWNSPCRAKFLRQP